SLLWKVLSSPDGSMTSATRRHRRVAARICGAPSAGPPLLQRSLVRRKPKLTHSLRVEENAFHRFHHTTNQVVGLCHAGAHVLDDGVLRLDGALEMVAGLYESGLEDSVLLARCTNLLFQSIQTHRVVFHALVNSRHFCLAHFHDSSDQVVGLPDG